MKKLLINYQQGFMGILVVGLTLVIVGCAAWSNSQRLKNIVETKLAQSLPADFEGDGMGSQKPGEVSSEVVSADKLWKTYLVQSEDRQDHLWIEGQDGFKKELLVGSGWPLEFSYKTQ